MKKDIIWLENGWILVQDADPDKHELEIAVLAKDGKIVEIRKRHNDGEEEIVKNVALPMAIDDFKKGIKKGTIKFK